MADIGTTTLDEGQPQLDAAREFERERLEQNLAKQQQARLQQKAQPLKSDPAEQLAEQALETLRKSPAGFNPIIRIILVANNLINRMLGKKPDSAETLTMVAKVVVPMVLLLALALAIIIIAAIIAIGYVMTQPVEAAWCFLKIAAGGSCT